MCTVKTFDDVEQGSGQQLEVSGRCLL